jgi:hypothetical protein
MAGTESNKWRAELVDNTTFVGLDVLCRRTADCLDYCQFHTHGGKDSANESAVQGWRQGHGGESS